MNGSQLKEIVTLYVKPPINWPREMKVAKRLTESRPNIDYWRRLHLGPINCLAWFLTRDGEKFLTKSDEKYKEFLGQEDLKKNREKVMDSLSINIHSGEKKDFTNFLNLQ